MRSSSVRQTLLLYVAAKVDDGSTAIEGLSGKRQSRSCNRHGLRRPVWPKADGDAGDGAGRHKSHGGSGDVTRAL
jgi:hypothetical protein